jgi:hypothetical protein
MLRRRVYDADRHCLLPEAADAVNGTYALFRFDHQ